MSVTLPDIKGLKQWLPEGWTGQGHSRSDCRAVQLYGHLLSLADPSEKSQGQRDSRGGQGKALDSGALRKDKRVFPSPGVRWRGAPRGHSGYRASNRKWSPARRPPPGDRPARLWEEAASKQNPYSEKLPWTQNGVTVQGLLGCVGTVDSLTQCPKGPGGQECWPETSGLLWQG